MTSASRRDRVSIEVRQHGSSPTTPLDLPTPFCSVPRYTRKREATALRVSPSKPRGLDISSQSKSFQLAVNLKRKVPSNSSKPILINQRKSSAQKQEKSINHGEQTLSYHPLAPRRHTSVSTHGLLSGSTVLKAIVESDGNSSMDVGWSAGCKHAGRKSRKCSSKSSVGKENTMTNID